MKDYYLLIGLNKNEVKINNIEQKNNCLIEVSIENKMTKVRCLVCNKFTSSVHSKLKPIRSVYLDSCGTKIDLITYKKRYHCYNCKKIFIEELNINASKGNISNKVKIQIRKDLLNYNLSLKYISKKNMVSITTVENESSKFWLGVLNDLKQRGVKDILIMCSDNLTGIKEAINAAFPNTIQQRCIVHMIRNSVKFASYKDLRVFCNDLKSGVSIDI